MAARLPADTDRKRLIEDLDQSQRAYDDWLRHMILERDRIDLLMTKVLDLEVRPYHFDMLKHRMRNRKRSMVLAWRGAGKTFACTVAYAIFKLLKDPNERILIVSRSGSNAENMANLIRLQFESNETLRRIFGEYVGPRWDQRKFWVKPRTDFKAEASVATVGMEGAVVSQHYTCILADDLVDRENALTSGMRQKTQEFFYTSLLPCLEPDGELHVAGTRYHHADLYGHLMEGPDGEMVGERTLVIPVLRGSDAEGWTSTWERDFPAEEMLRRRKQNLLAFETQMQCSTALMIGEMFSFADFRLIPRKEIPQGLPRHIGLDLAIALDRPNDYFVVAVIDYDPLQDMVYVRDVKRWRGIPTHVQRQRFIDLYDQHECSGAVNESNFYQAAFSQDVKKDRPDIRIADVQSKVDKVTRAWDLVARIQNQKIAFADDLADLFDEMVQFPKGEHDDQVDALGAAVKAARGKVRKPRKEVTLDWSTRAPSA